MNFALLKKELVREMSLSHSHQSFAELLARLNFVQEEENRVQYLHSIDSYDSAAYFRSLESR